MVTKTIPIKDPLYTFRSIRTVSGKYIDVFEPKEDDILIEDIAHALSNQCRFGGHLLWYYSVAQHSWQCSKLADQENKLAALMHDASEAYLLDIPSPIKRQLANYKELEDNLMKIIAKKFGFQYPFHPQIKEIDKYMLELEWERLMLGNEVTIDLIPTSPEMSKRLFIEEYRKLSNGNI